MAFVPTTVAPNYSPSPPSVLDSTERAYLDRELRRIMVVVNNINDAVKEIQDYLRQNT